MFPLLNLIVLAAEFDALFEEKTLVLIPLVLVYVVDEEVEFL